MGGLPLSTLHVCQLEHAHIVVVGTKAFFLKELKDSSAITNWPPQWLLDIEHISYVLPIMGIRTYAGKSFVQTPLQQCNLRTWLENPANRVPRNIQRVFAQILFAIDWIGEYGKFLGNIKPENIFLVSGNPLLDISAR